MRRQPFILLSFSSSKKARKAQETQSYQRFQCIGHTDFKGLSNAVTNTHPLLPSMGTTRQKNSCRNRLQNGLHSLLRMKVGTHTRLCQQDRTQRLTRRNRGCFGWGRYYYPRRALRVAETPDGRLSKRLTCRFLRSGEQRSLRSAYFFRICRIFCRQFQLQTLLRYGTINPRNWKNFRTIMPLNSRLQLQVPHRGHAPNNRKEVLSHEETHLLGSGSPPAAEPCRLRGWSRPQFLRVLRRCLLFRRVFSDGRP